MALDLLAESEPKTGKPGMGRASSPHRTTIACKCVGRPHQHPNPTPLHYCWVSTLFGFGQVGQSLSLFLSGGVLKRKPPALPAGCPARGGSAVSVVETGCSPPMYCRMPRE